jgi:hypothetical protein
VALNAKGQSMTIQLTTASRVLAQLRARNAVKRELQKHGLKLNHFAAKDIASWALVYLDDHPELFPEAIANARAMILKGALGKRAQRALIETIQQREKEAQ